MSPRLITISGGMRYCTLSCNKVTLQGLERGQKGRKSSRITKMIRATSAEGDKMALVGESARRIHLFQREYNSSAPGGYSFLNEISARGEGTGVKLG